MVGPGMGTKLTCVVGPGVGAVLYWTVAVSAHREPSSSLSSGPTLLPGTSFAPPTILALAAPAMDPTTAARVAAGALPPPRGLWDMDTRGGGVVVLVGDNFGPDFAAPTYRSLPLPPPSLSHTHVHTRMHARTCTQTHQHTHKQIHIQTQPTLTIFSNDPHSVSLSQ